MTDQVGQAAQGVRMPPGRRPSKHRWPGRQRARPGLGGGTGDRPGGQVAGRPRTPRVVRPSRRRIPPAGAGQAQEAAGQAAQQGQQAGGEAEEPKATNAARRKAEQMGLDLSTIEGTGSGGLITIKDVTGS